MDDKEEINTGGSRRSMGAENSDTVVAKKRARRVSFAAEMTSVHFFDRDEEYNETPMVDNAKILDDSPAGVIFGGLLERSKEFVGEDDGDDNVDDEEMEMQRSFLQPIGSPSPRGSILGSASFNDEDNFFGPVSANFIRPGRLSDSGVSDDNHDVTMDSTAFSMHYRSLAVSESGVDLKTPTGGKLFLEEKTPTSSNKGSSMVFTLGKKLMQKSSVPATEISANKSSNDMSLLGENPNKYDYEKLSPGLDALLAESRKNLLYVSVSDDITSVSPNRNKEQVSSSVDHGNNLVNLSDSVREGSGWNNSNSVLNGDQPDARTEFGDANGSHGDFLAGRSPKTFSASTLGAETSIKESQIPSSSPYKLSKNESVSSLVESTSSLVKFQQILPTTASPSKPWGMTSPLPENHGSLLKNVTIEDQENETSIQKSISKLELLEKDAFPSIVTASPPKPWGMISPLPEKHGSLLKNGTIDDQETETSIQKSISKLELLEKDAFLSAFSSKVDNSTIKSLDFFKSPNVMGKNHDLSRINSMEDSVNEEKLASVHLSTDRNFAYEMDPARGDNHLEKSLSQAMNGKSQNKLSSNSISAGKSESGLTAASPSKITWTGNNLARSLFTSKLNSDDSFMTETESLVAETAFCERGKAVTPKFASSPYRLLDKNLPASPGHQSSLSTDLRSQFKHITDFDKGQDSNPERNSAHVNLSSATDSTGVLSKGMSGEVNSHFIEVNHLNSFELRTIDNIGNDIYNAKERIQTSGNFSTPEKENQVLHLDDADPKIRETSSSAGNIPRIESKMLSHESGSPTYRNLNQTRLQFPAGSPSRKVLDKFSRIPSPKTIQRSGGLENFSANKRNLDLLLSDLQHRTEAILVERSPKLQKICNYDPEKIVYSIESRIKLTAQEEQKLADAYSKFSEDMKILIFGSATKLSSKKMDVLEDMLVHQERLKVYEMLQHGAGLQSTIVHHDLQLEKIAETKSLFHRVVFEKAKMQLKRVKRERLLKRLDLLSSRMQESQTLRANIASLPLEICSSNVGGTVHRSLSVNLTKEHEVCHDKLTTMRQDLEAVDRKVLNLMRAFYASCKLKPEPGIVETIAAVNDHLIKKISCRFIRLDMQMWVVEGISSVNGQHNVILNYLGFVVQSTKVTIGPTSSVKTSFTLNETNITKIFPNMDACIAFRFVFEAETTHKYVGPRSLVQETQVTSMLLGSLLDVVEEVQKAQTEFKNLTQSSFSSQSGERLDLILCFFNFNSRTKITLTFDLSCLKQGIYPSEILPLQLASPVHSSTCSSSERILDKIGDAVKDVRSGYTRILRLLECISHVVQASTA